jgi:hypothetical protein
MLGTHAHASKLKKTKNRTKLWHSELECGHQSSITMAI